MSFIPEFFLSRQLYGKGPAGHRAWCEMQPGWRFIELVDWMDP